MSFIERAFTPPGTGAFVPPPAIPPPAGAPAPPPAPTLPTAPAPPPQFRPGQAPGAQQRAQITGTSVLGAAATSGQTAKKTLLGA